MSKSEDLDAGLILAGLFAAPFSWAFKGYVLSKLWAWFVFPWLGHQVSISQAFGISLIFVGMVPGSTRHDETRNEQLTTLVAMFAVPLVILAIGAVVHSIT